MVLCSFAEEAGIESYESKPKIVLFAKLSKEFSFERLMRIEAKKLSINNSSNRSQSSLSFGPWRRRKKSRNQQNSQIVLIHLHPLL